MLVERLRAGGLTITETGGGDWSIEPIATSLPSRRAGPSASTPRAAIDTIGAAGQLAERGVAPLYLVAHPDWASQLAGAAAGAWREALALLGLPSDAPPTGREAIVLPPRRTPLPQVIEHLRTGGASARLLSEAGIWLEIANGRIELCGLKAEA